MNYLNIFSKRYCEMDVAEENVLLRIRLKGLLSLEQMKEINSFSREFNKKHGINSILVIQSELKILTKEVQEYLIEMLHESEKEGMKKIAIVQAESIFTQVIVDRIHVRFKGGNLDTRTFVTEKEATEWLFIPEKI